VRQSYDFECDRLDSESPNIGIHQFGKQPWQNSEQLQQFGKPTWHPSNFGKTRKIGSNSLANELGKNRNLAKLTSPRVYMRTWIVVAIGVSL
jgi:hypothetical protein